LLRRPISKTQSAFLLLRGAVCEKNSTHLDAIVPFAAVVAIGCMYHATLSQSKKELWEVGGPRIRKGRSQARVHLREERRAAFFRRAAK
jgi:hypothetical protein